MRGGARHRLLPRRPVVLRRVLVENVELVDGQIHLSPMQPRPVQTERFRPDGMNDRRRGAAVCSRPDGTRAVVATNPGLAAGRSVLLAQQLGTRTRHLRGRRDRDRRGFTARPPDAPAPRDVAEPSRHAGRAARRGRPDPRVRPFPCPRPVRGSAGRGRRGRERDRDDVPQGPTPGRAGPDAFARATPSLQRPGPPRVSRGTEQSGDAERRRPGKTFCSSNCGAWPAGRSVRPRSHPRPGCTWMP